MTTQRKRHSALFTKALSVLLVVCMVCGTMLPILSVTATAAAPVLVIDAAGGTNYSLFNSGRTTSGGYDAYKDKNPAPDTYNNSGYDLYGTIGSSSTRKFRLGLSFTVTVDITERSTLSVKAYDVDESYRDCGYGYEHDYVYLVDETTGTSTKLTPHLSGQNGTWNTTVIGIEPSLFTKGHTYHFELQMTCTGNHSCSYYSVTVRTVDMIVNGNSTPPVASQIEADLSASITSSGTVSVALDASAGTAANYTLEYKAVTSGNQYGGKQYSVSVPTTTERFATSFSLESGSPRGTYEITLFIKNSNGIVVATRTVSASYGYSAVSYHSNGGSQNLPTDSKSYSSGNTVTVKFDYLPSLYGYNFLGWSTDRSATAPMYTENGNKTFTIGSSDVVLYAVWGSAACDHDWNETSRTNATCTADGVIVTACSACGETEETAIPALGHSYVGGFCSRCGAAEPSADQWDGSADTSWYSSSLSEFTIYTAEQLAGLAQLVNGGNSFSGKTIYLGNNIDLAGREWMPIGKGNNSEGDDCSTLAFSGTFNGNGYTVLGLSVNTTTLKRAGLFGALYNATVTMLGVKDAQITITQRNVVSGGVIAGTVAFTTIEKCDVSGTVSVTDTASEGSRCASAGMIIGLSYTLTLDSCVANGSVFGSMPNSWNAYVGGIVGLCFSGTITISNSYFCGQVNAQAYESGEAGGIAGRGGGSSIPVTINNCFTVAELTSSHSKDPLAFWRGALNVNNSYYSSTLRSDFGTSTTVSNLQSQSWIKANLGWDFDTVWEFRAGSDYPVLQGFENGGSGTVVPPHTHSFTETSRTNATCTADGVIVTTCSVCGETEETAIPALGHSYTGGFCSRCGAAEPSADEWDGSKDTSWYSSSLSEFTIYTAEQLAGLAQLVNGGNSFSGKTIYLGNNIDLVGYNWTPIGTQGTAFSGTFDGNKNIIWNLTITGRYQSAGLFGHTNRATVRNLGIENANINVNYSGAPTEVGALIGGQERGTVSHCYMKGSVTCSNNNQNPTGGLIGIHYSGTVSNCFAISTVTINANYDVIQGGGLIGATGWYHDETASVEKCFAISTLVGSSTYNGTLSGGMGGLVGDNYARTCTVSDCFTLNCTITTQVKKGAIYGCRNESALTLNRCYAANSNVSVTYGGLSTDASNLQSQSWIEANLGWDFNTVWEFRAGNDYPVLRGFGTGNGGSGPVVPPHTHSFTETSRADAGCTTYGEIVYTCSCGEIKIDLLEPIQHDYVTVRTVNATCTTDGYVEFACTNCSATKRQTIDRLGHDYGRDNVCDRCGHEINPHTHSYTTNTVAPTCSAMGYTEFTCSCGHSYRDNYQEPTRHTWDNGVITRAATCESDGLKTYTCQGCSVTKTEILPAGHDWSETVTVAKTCTTDGSKSKTCEACGATETEVIPAGHNWNEGNVTLTATCTTAGSKICTCADCGVTETFEVPELGHSFVNGVCTRCGIGFIEVVNPSEHPLYGMYFEIDDILSDYGPSLIDEYGLMLDYNSDATLEKVAVYLTQDGTMWRRCIAVKGSNIEYATYVPYLSYQSEIKYTGLNHDWINIFRLSENSEGIWCYSNYATIGVNLQDAYGNLLLSLYDIGQAGAQTRIFDDLEEMKAWLRGDCVDHTPSDWIVDTPASCMAGIRHKECTECGVILETEEIPPVGDHIPGEWVIDMAPTATQAGSRHRVCAVCNEILETESIPVLAKITVDTVTAAAGHTVRVAIDMQSNPGILGAVLTLRYDPALKLVDVQMGSALSSLNFTRPSGFTSPCNFVWDGAQDADYANGTMLILTFEVPANAAVGTIYTIEAFYARGNMIGANLEPVDFVVEGGSISVEELVGDVNGDGYFDVADIVTLRRYLAGGYNVTVDTEAADIDNDGEITVADVVLLRRRLVW